MSDRHLGARFCCFAVASHLQRKDNKVEAGEVYAEVCLLPIIGALCGSEVVVDCDVDDLVVLSRELKI